MTAQIDFYIINVLDLTQASNFITKLVNKAYHLNNPLMIKGDDSLLQRVNSILWQNFDFIPHHFDQSLQAIVVKKRSESKANILLTLNADSTADIANWHRIIHIVSSNDKQKLAAREAYRYYQQLGLTIKTHKIRTLND